MCEQKPDKHSHDCASENMALVRLENSVQLSLIRVNTDNKAKFHIGIDYQFIYIYINNI